MRLEDKLAAYLEYCEYRKELDRKTLKAYRIDLRQYFEYICVDEPDKEKIEEYVTHLHKLQAKDCKAEDSINKSVL